MDEEEALTLETRRRVFQFIRAHPGLHLRALERRLGIALGNLRYHLDYLERENFVTSRSDGYRKTYFSARDVYLLDRDRLALLRQRVPRRIILHLVLTPTSSFEDLRDLVGVSKSTLSFHLKKLTETGVVTVRRREGRNEYFLEEPKRVVELLITYQSSFLDSAIDRTLEVWLS